MSDERVLLSDSSNSKIVSTIDNIIHNNNDEMGAAIMILQQIQTAFGYVSPEMLERVSQWTGISTSALYSIVTFYAQFRLVPVGENVLKVCHGTACHLAGSEKITEAVEIEAGAKTGQTSADGIFTVEKVACLGCCSQGPVMTLNDETLAKMTPEAARKIVKKLREGCSCGEHDDTASSSREKVTVSE